MSKIVVLVFFVFLITSAFQKQFNNKNTFTSHADTLFLETSKMKGDTLFNIGAGEAVFRDTNSWKQADWFKYYPNYPVKYPNTLQNLELGFISIKFDTLTFFDSSTHKIYKQQNNDLADRFILMIKGEMNGKEIFIVDQNYNKNFTDDTIRVFHDLNWKSTSDLIPVQYIIDFGIKKVEATSWFKIGMFRGMLLGLSSQFLCSTLTIDGEKFVLGIADANSSSFDFQRPIIYSLIDNGLPKDTLVESDIVKFKEYIKLGKNYYRFENIHVGSGTIVLVKENNFNNLVGTQKGMLAPVPTFKTIAGHTYSIDNFSDKPILVANFSGCTPKSFDVYKAIVEKYAGKINIIGLEYDIKDEIGGLIVDIKDSINADFYSHYRNAYSSYDCYLINSEKRILDKFQLFDWEKAIEKHF